MTAKRNILIALMLLLLVAASACALVACNNTTAEISGVQIATDDNGDPMYGGGSYVMPEGMAFSAAASTAAETDTSVTLTANYEPAGTSNKQTNWSVSFKNPSSSWANGKTVTDYVTVESTGTNTAKVTCVKDFGEQIIVTATSAVDPSISATTTVDYEKKFKDVRITLLKGSSVLETATHGELIEDPSNFSYLSTDVDFEILYANNLEVFDGQYTIKLDLVFSDYTIDKDIKLYQGRSEQDVLGTSCQSTFDGTYYEGFGASTDANNDAYQALYSLCTRVDNDSTFAMAWIGTYNRYFKNAAWETKINVDSSNERDVELYDILVYISNLLPDSYDINDTDFLLSTIKPAFKNIVTPIVQDNKGYYYNSEKIGTTLDEAKQNFYVEHTFVCTSSDWPLFAVYDGGYGGGYGGEILKAFGVGYAFADAL